MGILTPVQIEGLRLLLTPFPQEEFNQTEWEITSGQNEALKKYAIAALPDVMEHLEMAKQQYAMLTSGAPPAK